MTTSFSKTFSGAFLVFTGSVFFSAKAVLVKLGFLQDASVMLLLNMRMVFALPFFIVTVILTNRKAPKRISRKDGAYVIFLGIIGYYMASYFDFKGLTFISAGLERLILFIYPTIVVILSAFLFKTPIGKRQLIALLLTYAGVSIAYSAETTTASDNLMKGSLLVFGSAFTYAIYLIGSGRMIPRLGALRFTSYCMIVSTIAVLVHSFCIGELSLITTPEIYLIGFIMAIFTTVIPSFMLAEGIKQLGSGPTAIIASIGPVSTIVLAAVFLNEPVTGIQILGTGLVICGVLFVSKKEKVKKKIALIEK